MDNLNGEGEHEPAMTIREVSEHLQLSESTIYRLAQEGKLPGRKVGGAWRFPPKRIFDQWLSGLMDKGQGDDDKS